MNGQAQREALSAAERAIVLLGRGDHAEAVAAARRAALLDQVGAFAGLPAAVAETPLDWDMVAAALGAGPLQQLVAEIRP